MSTIDSTGYHRTSEADRLAELIASFQSIYGTDIDVTPQSPDGQWLGILANLIAEADELIEDVYRMRSPSGASGAALSRLALLTGVQRKPAAFSTAPVTLGGTPGTVIPIGSLVGSDGLDGHNKAVWETVAEYVIGPGGTVAGQVRAQTSGPVLAEADHINAVRSVIAGWTSIANTSAATPGTNVETDPALRVRRAKSVALPSQGLTDSMFAAVSQLDDVSSVAIYENYGDTTDGNGLPPHSLYAVVAGGVDAEIAQAMWLRKAMGCTLVGSKTFTIIDAQGNPQVMRWDEPTQVNTYVTVVLDTAVSTDVQAQIIANLYAWGAGTLTDAAGNVISPGSQIGQQVVRSRLFVPLNMIPGLDIANVFLGSAPNPTTPANLPIGFNEIAHWDPSFIVVQGP